MVVKIGLNKWLDQPFDRRRRLQSARKYENQHIRLMSKMFSTLLRLLAKTIINLICWGKQ